MLWESIRALYSFQQSLIVFLSLKQNSLPKFTIENIKSLKFHHGKNAMVKSSLLDTHINRNGKMYLGINSTSKDSNFCILFQTQKRVTSKYLSKNRGGVDATPIVITFEGQKVFAVVLLQGIRAARRGSNTQMSRNVLPSFLLCALWVKQKQNMLCKTYQWWWKNSQNGQECRW